MFHERNPGSELDKLQSRVEVSVPELRDSPAQCVIVAEMDATYKGRFECCTALELGADALRDGLAA